MLFGIIEFGIKKAIIRDVIGLAGRVWQKKSEPVVRERLHGYNVDEFMRATPEEIKQRMKEKHI